MILIGLLFMVLGLILISVVKVHDSNPVTEKPITMNGFDILQTGHIGSWLSSKYVWDTFKEYNQLSALMTLRAGIAFAVLLTPIIGTLGIAGFLFYTIPVKNKKVIENEQVVTIQK